MRSVSHPCVTIPIPYARTVHSGAVTQARAQCQHVAVTTFHGRFRKRAGVAATRESAMIGVQLMKNADAANTAFMRGASDMTTDA